jgi:hypothetical protein
MHSGDIEIAVAKWYDYRRYFIVPNVSYGLNIHEVDMLVISPSDWATEIEIKISIADLKADLKKSHGHRSNKIKYLYFAIPEELKEKAKGLIPERAGLLIVKEDKYGYTSINKVKTACINKTARKITSDERLQLGRLAAMRIWSLKQNCYRLAEENRNLRGNLK